MIEAMAYNEFVTYAKAINQIRSKERIDEIISSSFPHMKENSRKKIMSNLKRNASDPSNAKPLTTEELAKMIDQRI